MSPLQVETAVLPHPLTHDDMTAVCADDIFVGCVEVKAIEDPISGEIVKDEITVLVPLELDEDPLYYYPPSMSLSTPDAAKMSDSDSSDSDSDDEEDDDFDDALVITNHHAMTSTSTQPTKEVEPETYSFMEELLQTLDTIFGCNYGVCGDAQEPLPVLKSALRRKGLEQPKINRNVSWTKLEIKEFNMTLGNHPSAVTGPPVMLETTHSRESVVDLETYEKARQPRRTRRQLKLSFEARRGILERDRGFTVEEVKKAWSEALLIRKQRQETRQRTPQQQLFDEVYESACRKANRMFLWQ